MYVDDLEIEDEGVADILMGKLLNLNLILKMKMLWLKRQDLEHRFRDLYQVQAKLVVFRKTFDQCPMQADLWVALCDQERIELWLVNQEEI